MANATTTGNGDDGNGNGNRGWRITIDPRISFGSLIQIFVLLAGGMWAFADLSAKVTALKESVSDFKMEVRSHLSALDFQVAGKADKPPVSRP